MVKKLTILIPAYNADRYLEKCLSSLIVENNLEDLEVIIVNDGSTDNTKNIALDYINKYPRIFKLIEKGNGGYGSALNVGIKEATGKYLKILDADDWVETKALEKLLLRINEINTSLIFLNYKRVIKNKEYIGFAHQLKKIKFDKVYQVKDLNDKFFYKIHSLVMKTELLNKDNFPLLDEGVYYTDLELIAFLIPSITDIIFLDEALYCYRLGMDTQTVNPSVMRKRVNDYELVVARVLDFYNQMNEKNKCDLESHISKVYSGLLKIYLSQKLSACNKQKILELEESIKKNYYNIYKGNTNMAIKILRLFKYNIYIVAHMLVSIKERLK